MGCKKLVTFDFVEGNYILKMTKENQAKDLVKVKIGISKDSNIVYRNEMNTIKFPNFSALDFNLFFTICYFGIKRNYKRKTLRGVKIKFSDLRIFLPQIKNKKRFFDEIAKFVKYKLKLVGVDSIEYDEMAQEDGTMKDLDNGKRKLKGAVFIKNYILDEEKEELILELSSPKEKQDFLKNTLENTKANEKLGESLDILEALDENAKLIKEKEEQIKEDKQRLENKEENKLDEKIENKANEAYDKQVDELLKQHEAELARLKEERERLEENFEKSIENLLNSKDLGDVLKTLQEMDKAFALMMKQAYEEANEKHRQREEKIELAVKSTAMKEVAKDLVKEIHSKSKELNGGLETMKQEQGAFIELDRMMKREPSDIKEIKKMENFYQKTDKELPNFKENYPKSYAKGLKMIEKGKEKFLNNTLGQTQFQQQARTMV
ncbi:hypothetical protein [Campylobacter helveticus]|uniref:hypothetical protein n=6 Tax=Campylobacter helveticus TaxID=28898 RepID=UPI00242BD18E|nr:hypothetical protein [Campylobacter helveticus]